MLCGCIHFFHSVAKLFIWWIIEGIAHIEALGVSLIVDYLPFSASSSLIHEPVTRMNFVQQVGNMATGGEGLNYDYSIPTTAVIVCIVYTIILSFAYYFMVKKRDL